MASSRRKAHGDGWLLVGDAASIVCPTSGEGVGGGMLSGYTAAHFIKRAVEQNCYEEKMFKGYDREIHRRLSLEENLYRFIGKIPAWFFTAGVNTILGSYFFKQWVTRKEMQRWIDTAYRKPITVNMND